MNFLVSADVSFEPISNLGSLCNGESPDMGNEGILKGLPFIFKPLLGRYDFA